MHVFGAYCLFYIPKENRDGKFRPPSEMGIWVGLDPRCLNGHYIVPIKWQHSTQSWVLGKVVTATTVKVWDEVFPLRTAPPPGTVGTVEFDLFMDRVVNPLYGERDPLKGKLPTDLEVDSVQPEVGLVESVEPVPNSLAPKPKRANRKEKRKARKPEVESDSDYESWDVESVIGTRINKGIKQYKVKWKDFDNRSNSWVNANEVKSPELVSDFQSSKAVAQQAQLAQSPVKVSQYHNSQTSTSRRE